MKVFEWTGIAPDDGIALEPETKHAAPTHAVCIRLARKDQLEITYFTGRGSVRKTVAGICALMIVTDPERLGLSNMTAKREVPRDESVENG